VVYNFAKSTKGGTADVYIDGAFKSQIPFTCPSCNHQANHETERYWHPAIEGMET
jgi:hypothetical protein